MPKIPAGALALALSATGAFPRLVLLVFALALTLALALELSAVGALPRLVRLEPPPSTNGGASDPVADLVADIVDSWVDLVYSWVAATCAS